MAAIWRRRCRAGYSPRCTTASRRRRELCAGDAAHGSTVRGGRASARQPVWVRTTGGTADTGRAAGKGYGRAKGTGGMAGKGGRHGVRGRLLSGTVVARGRGAVVAHDRGFAPWYEGSVVIRLPYDKSLHGTGREGSPRDDGGGEPPRGWGEATRHPISRERLQLTNPEFRQLFPELGVGKRASSQHVGPRGPTQRLYRRGSVNVPPQARIHTRG